MCGSNSCVRVDNSEDASGYLVIKGVTVTGMFFRPSDWAQRLAGAGGSRHSDGRFLLHPLVRVVIVDGLTAVVIDKELIHTEPHLYNFFRKFGSDNDLEMYE